MLVQSILKRILIGVVTLLVVSIIIFIGTSLLPGDVANIILGQMATPEALAVLREHLGLDQPPHVRYLMWLGNLIWVCRKPEQELEQSEPKFLS